MSDSLEQIIAQINKRAKRDLIVTGGDVVPIGRTTSGSLTLDVVLGGGWPQNRWTELIGEASHGKTTIALKTIAANQAKSQSFTTAWVRAEEYDEEWAATLGVDNKRVHFIDTNVMEDAYQAALDLISSKDLDLLVLDSLAALVPSAEDDKAMEEFTVGRGAQVTNKFFRKALVSMHREIGERPCVGLVINQWRQKIGVMYGDPRTTPGGNGKDYAFSVRAEIKRDEWLEVGTGESKRKVGQRIRARTLKNKTAPGQLSAYFDFYFADGAPVRKGDYDFARECVQMGVYYDIIERRGAFYFYGGQQWRGIEATLEAIRQDVELKETLERDVLARVNQGV
jgi:recombination protein RecA